MWPTDDQLRAEGARVSRRALFGLAAALTGAALAGTAACTGGPARPQPSPTPDPLAPVLAGTQALIGLYVATIEAQPSLADRLTPLLAEHREHAAALRFAMGVPAASGSASAPVEPTPSGTVPGDPASALAALVGAERTAQASAVQDCLSSSPEHAGLLAAIAASRACHLEVLA